MNKMENGRLKGGNDMPQCIVVADDLTGACDSGIQLHKRGYAVQVLERFINHLPKKQ